MDWDWGDAQTALEALRQIGRPGRGLSDDFYRLVAQQYKALVAEGEKYPVKALAEAQPVHISYCLSLDPRGPRKRIHR